MSIKISELPVASSVNSADIVPIVQDGTTKQAQAEMFKPQIETVINSSSTNDKPVGAEAVYDYSAPIKHDSETQEYGVATTTKYGHTKIIDNLDSSSYQVGESLSAYQGAVLKQSIDNINDDIESITDELATKQTISNMTNTLDENSISTQYPNAQVTFEKYNELLNQIPTATATGNPINVQDSSNLPIKDFALLGNATQFTTTGKNMLNVESVTLNAYFDGANGNVLTDNTGANCVFNDYIPVVAGNNYIFKINGATTASTIISYCEYDTNKSFLNYYSYTDRGSITITPTSGTSYIRFRYKYQNNYQLTVSFLEQQKLQVESGSTATSYEPYTGGKASPNSDYPQDIHVVTRR